MGGSQLSFLADEHVPRMFVTVLKSNEIDVTTAQERYGQGSVDETILDDCNDEKIVVITNDRDFVRKADDQNHAGIIMYTDRAFLVNDPVGAAEAIGRLRRYYTAEDNTKSGRMARKLGIVHRERSPRRKPIVYLTSHEPDHGT